VTPGAAGVSTRGELLVYLEAGRGYDARITVGEGDEAVVSIVSLPDISPDVDDAGGGDAAAVAADLAALEAELPDTYDQIGAAAAAAAASVPKSLVDAAGDLLVGTGDNTVGRLAKGSALQVLRVNAGGTALEYAASAGGDVTQEELDDGLALKLDIAAAALLSDNVPLIAFGAGTAGTSNDSARGDHVHPEQDFTLAQPLDLVPAAIDEPALIVRALASQTGNLVEWRTEADTLIAAVGAGVVDVSDGFGFPQYTGFPRLRGLNYSTFGLLRCSGAFWVEHEFFLVGTSSISGGQANYGNTGLSLNDGNLTMTAFSPGSNTKWFFHEGMLVPQLRMGSFAVDFTAALNIGTATAGSIGAIIQGSASQTADLSQWQDDSAAILSRFNKAGFFMTRKKAAPADGDLVASELAVWLDDTNGAAKAMFKAKQADGTVRTAAVALA
jgi:hypothetical protein